MTDNFALLDEPRRPWLDPEALKRKFLGLSSRFHPDRVHQSPEAERQAASHRFTDLNAAYNCLREPKERLRHLLELERGEKPADIQQIPQETTETFFEIGRLCRETDTFLAEKARLTSPILLAQLFVRGQEWADRLMAMAQRIESRRAALLTELHGMNSAWESSPPANSPPTLPLARIEEIYRLLGYFARWSRQIQERIVQLSL